MLYFCTEFQRKQQTIINLELTAYSITMATNQMEKYNYLDAVKADVAEYIEENEIVVTSENREEVEQQLYDDCFIADSVTGNASGSYYCNAWKAEEAIAHNWDLLGEAAEEFGSDSIAEVLKQGAEACDVTIRCYVLGQAIAAVLDEILEDED
jgi:hypothetical protein